VKERLDSKISLPYPFSRFDRIDPSVIERNIDL